MGLAAASALLPPQEAAASPEDGPTLSNPQDIIREVTKQVTMMGFLKPLTAEERDAKEQRDLAKFKADSAAKQAANAEASKKAATGKRPPGRPRKLVSDFTVKLKPTAAAQKVKSGQRRSYRNSPDDYARGHLSR